MKLVDRLLLKIQQTSDYLQVNTNVFWHIFRCWIVKKKERCCSKRFKKVPIHQHCFSLASKTFNSIVSSFFDLEMVSRLKYLRPDLQIIDDLIQKTTTASRFNFQGNHPSFDNIYWLKQFSFKCEHCKARNMYRKQFWILYAGDFKKNKS